MLNYWSLKILTSLSFKLSHSRMHRALELTGSGITEKVCGGGRKWLIPTYRCEGCISQRRCCLYYTFKAQSLKCKHLLNIEKAYRKRYWKFCISKSYTEIRHFTVKFCSIFRKPFKEFYYYYWNHIFTGWFCQKINSAINEGPDLKIIHLYQ